MCLKSETWGGGNENCSKRKREKRGKDCVSKTALCLYICSIFHYCRITINFIVCINKTVFRFYLWLHLIQNGIIWCKLKSVVPPLQCLPVSRANTYTENTPINFHLKDQTHITAVCSNAYSRTQTHLLLTIILINLISASSRLLHHFNKWYQTVLKVFKPRSSMQKRFLSRWIHMTNAISNIILDQKNYNCQ